VELRIGELVVDGVAMSGRDIVPFREAIEAALGGLLAGGGPLPQSSSNSAGPLLVNSPSTGPKALGTAAATAVYRGLVR
jgi:hypothetical protein